MSAQEVDACLDRVLARTLTQHSSDCFDVGQLPRTVVDRRVRVVEAERREEALCPEIVLIQLGSNPFRALRAEVHPEMNTFSLLPSRSRKYPA